MNYKKYRCIKNLDERASFLLFKDFIYEESYLKKYYFVIYVLIKLEIIISIEKYREMRINKILNND
jgi:hypothetical protein